MRTFVSLHTKVRYVLCTQVGSDPSTPDQGDTIISNSSDENVDVMMKALLEELEPLTWQRMIGKPGESSIPDVLRIENLHRVQYGQNDSKVRVVQVWSSHVCCLGDEAAFCSHWPGMVTGVRTSLIIIACSQGNPCTSGVWGHATQNFIVSAAHLPSSCTKVNINDKIASSHWTDPDSC